MKTRSSRALDRSVTAVSGQRVNNMRLRQVTFDRRPYHPIFAKYEQGFGYLFARCELMFHERRCRCRCTPVGDFRELGFGALGNDAALPEIDRTRIAIDGQPVAFR